MCLSVNVQENLRFVLLLLDLDDLHGAMAHIRQFTGCHGFCEGSKELLDAIVEWAGHEKEPGRLLELSFSYEV
jgi:hypothetical protein